MAEWGGGCLLVLLSHAWKRFLRGVTDISCACSGGWFLLWDQAVLRICEVTDHLDGVARGWTNVPLPLACFCQLMSYF